MATATVQHKFGPALTHDKVLHYKALQVRTGATPVRFHFHGQALSVETGQLQPKGINVIHQRVYWNFTKDVAKEIAKELGPDVKPVFSE